ncbi:MAG TPA: hypothetical protein VF326_10300 [Anaerolineaceae bacterium]
MMETDPNIIPQTTLSLEEMLKLGARHIDQLVDAQGRTYFDVYLTQPPEAVTDWADFIDLPARYWEAVALVEPVIASPVVAKDRLRSWLFRRFETDGLAYRPESPISAHAPELFDQSRLLYALDTWAMHAPEDVEVCQRITKMMDELLRRSTREGDYTYIEQIGLYFGGTLIRPALQAGLILNRPEWIDFAGRMARGLIDHSDLIKPDGSFKGHVHGALSALAGTLAYAIVAGDAHLLERARTGFDYARSISTRFGFIPEMAQREDDLIACETCTLMDYLDVALLLARHVDPAYWDVVELAARNHLWESQIRDGAWIGTAGGDDEDGIIRSRLSDRIVGAFAGWSAPHCLLAYHEQFGPGWVHTKEMRPLYLGKNRAMQNCCAGAGMRAVYQVWSNSVMRVGDQVSVNLSLDRATPDVHVTSFLPFEGRVRMTVARDCDLRWRRPAYCGPEDVRVQTSEGSSVRFIQDGPFLFFGHQSAGSVIEVTFPNPERAESITVGNAGYQQYRFDLQWRGDTLLAVLPDPTNPSSGYTRLMDTRVHTSYGDRGIGPIYQRQGWSAGLVVTPAPLVVASPDVDWYTL